MIYLHMNYSSNLPFFGDPYFYSKNPTHPEPNGSVDGKIIELGDCPSPWLPEGSNHWKESFMKSWNCLFFIKLIKTYRFLIKFIYLKIEHPTPSLVHDHVAIKIAGTPFRHNPCKCYCFDVYIITVYTYKTNHIYRGIPSRFNLTPCSW